MQLLRSFRISTYLTLAMAVLCLGYSEGGLLPEAPYITLFVLALVGVAYRMEGRWSLSLQAANMVGAILAVLLVGWTAMQFMRGSSSLIDKLPFPAVLLPFLGPMLMILIPAKLFRPKHVGDIWALQGIGVLAVSLGCAMANDIVFGLLLIIYLFCFVWSIALFHLYREIRPATTKAVPQNVSQRFYLLKIARRWSIAIVAVALFLFLITPRPHDSRWELPLAARGRMETGLSDGGLDLNKTGSLQQNKELAFQVYVEDGEGNPKLDLSPNQRWRGAVRSFYENGRWPADRASSLYVLDKVRPVSLPSTAIGQGRTASKKTLLPDFGPLSYYLTFTLHRNSGTGNLLADPVMWRPNDLCPVIVYGARTSSVQQRNDGNFEWILMPDGRSPSYCQVALPPSKDDLGPPMRVGTGYQELLTRLPNQQFAERLRRLSTDILERLINEGKLPPTILTELDPFTRKPLPKNHEAIARSLEAYLAHSGEYKYSLQLERSNRNIDPIEDFLLNSKSGHCQRFASSLALLLRSQGIPSQLVLGYRGCESAGDGVYLVRQYHAHSWVEVLIERPIPTNVDLKQSVVRTPSSQMAHHLLSLDPTPGEEANDSKDTLTNWLEVTRDKWETIFRDFILSYDSNSRGRVTASLMASLEETKDSIIEGDINWPTAIATGLSLFLLIMIGVRFVKRRRRIFPRAPDAADPVVPFHGRLIAILAKHGFVIRTGQTAREFTNEVAALLRNRSMTRECVSTPIHAADAYYSVRFGGRELTPQELEVLDADLTRLQLALETSVH